MTGRQSPLKGGFKKCSLYANPQKKLKKIKDIAPDVVRSVMQDGGDSDGDDDCITLDSDDEGIDFTDPKWMEEFLTDDDRARLMYGSILEEGKTV